MGDERSAAVGTLVSHRWPAGVTVEREGDVLRMSASPLGRADVAVIAVVAFGIPTVVGVLFASIAGVTVAALFAVAVLAVGYQRLRGAQRVTVDLAGATIGVEHVNPRIAGRLGLTARSVRFTDVASVEVTRVLTGSRVEPLGRRIALRLHDGTLVVLAEFAAAATGATFARAIATVVDAPLREP
ncbi:MAG: hypothetical protein KDB40_02180 [Acidimicrobiales bacterium]|nr:hypothetical protein [Acidimicrobiales bacterium]MCB9393334.1 hypothetical protein [Acidimicrobiaceae bacterium]